jgi:PEGA domain
MMGRIRAGLALFLLLVAAGAAVSTPVRAETPTGAVYVTTLPSDADIWIDGVYVGRAPVLVDALAPGHHSLTITKTGWVVDEVDVTVTAASVAMSSTRLVAGPAALAGTAVGMVVLRGIPAGATLTLDGAPLDAVAGRDLTMPAGRHRITAETARGKYTRSITVLPDTATEVVLREPPASDTHSVVVAPAEDYLPTDNFSLEGKKIVVRYAGHLVVAYLGEQQVRIDGATVSYDGAPQAIDGKLYLPLALLEKLTEDTSNGR